MNATNEFLEHISINALKDIEQQAYDVFWDEKREHGNYEDAALHAIKVAIHRTTKLIEPPRVDEGAILLSELYWDTVSN